MQQNRKENEGSELNPESKVPYRVELRCWQASEMLYILRKPGLHYGRTLNQRAGGVAGMVFAVLNRDGCQFHLQRLRFVVHGLLATVNLHECHWHSYIHWFQTTNPSWHKELSFKSKPQRDLSLTLSLNVVFQMPSKLLRYTTGAQGWWQEMTDKKHLNNTSLKI